MKESGFVPQIEQEILGTLLSGGDLKLAVTILKAHHFIYSAHQLIFDACCSAFEKYSSCKLNIVSQLIDDDEFKSLHNVEGKNKGQYLASLVADVTYGNPRLEENCIKVLEQWGRLTLSSELSLLSEDANNRMADVREIARNTGELVDEVMTEVRGGTTNKKTLFTASDGLHQARLEVEAAKLKGSGLTGLTWGWSDVNRLTGGVQKENLTLIAARPSIGKTTVATSFALKATKVGHSVVLFSLEMRAAHVMLRCFSDHIYDRGGKIPYASIIRGEINDDEMAKIIDAENEFRDLPLIIEDQSGLTMADIRFKIERLINHRARKNELLDCVIIDHIGLIKPSGRYSGSKVNEVSEISAELKDMSREFGIAVVALSQLSRGVESRDNKCPVISDLRDSGSLEQDADTVILLYREAAYLERNKTDENVARLIECQNDMDFIIAKQRNGPITKVRLFVEMGYSAVRMAA